MPHLQKHFNSRPSARGDEHPRGVYVLGIGISIHAPPRGATQLIGIGCGSSIFQFTPLREGRLDYDELNIECEVFQFTPLREGRRPG